MHDTADAILDCGFPKQELPFIKKYFRSLYSFIHTSDFKEHKLYFYNMREKDDESADGEFVYHNAFIKNKATNWKPVIISIEQ